VPDETPSSRVIRCVHIPKPEWRQMRGNPRKDDRQSSTSAAPPTPQYRSVDIARAANILSQQAAVVREAIEAYERAKELPPGALDFKVSF
jgi:hypothetical protein